MSGIHPQLGRAAVEVIVLVLDDVSVAVGFLDQVAVVVVEVVVVDVRLDVRIGIVGDILRQPI